jgi:hypothetical protein
MRIIIALFLTFDQWVDRRGTWANNLFCALLFAGFFTTLAYFALTAC